MKIHRYSKRDDMEGPNISFTYSAQGLHGTDGVEVTVVPDGYRESATSAARNAEPVRPRAGIQSLCLVPHHHATWSESQRIDSSATARLYSQRRHHLPQRSNG